jgi:hypothetical protein
LRVFLRTFELRQALAEAAGYNVYPRVFHSPLLLKEEIDWPRLRSRRHLPGIDLRPAAAAAWLDQLSAFVPELDSIPSTSSGKELFWFDNDSFTDFDAAALHSILRWLKPARYIELGCGFSSFISSRALLRNLKDGRPCDAVYADPEPRRDMGQMLAHGRLVQKRVQDLPLEMFAALADGDILSIDTSHVLKLQSDVERELVEILPSLRPGVWIHFHDVFTPYDYPEDWLSLLLPMAANEQYALECLLSGGERYRVALPLYLLWKEKNEVVRKFFPRGRARPHSFWMQKQA